MREAFKFPKELTSLDTMRIDKLAFVTKLADHGKPEDMPVVDKANMVTEFFGYEEDHFDRFTDESMHRLFAYVATMFANYERSEPPAKLTYEGVTYIWNEDFTKMSVGWHRDTGKYKPTNNPIAIASYCYIEEGMTYAQPHPTRKDKFVINPTSARSKVFAEHLPLSTYLDIQGFFLESWPVLQRVQVLLKAASQINGIGSEALIS